MAVKVNLGVSKKVGLPDYGSAGASCNLEMEVSQELLDGDLAGFHEKVRSAYVAAQQAVQDQLQRLQGASPRPTAAVGTNGRTGHGANGHGPDGKRTRTWGGPPAAEHAPARPHKPATDKQLAKIRALVSRRDDTDLRELLHDLGIGSLAGLDVAGASGLIDMLLASDGA
jgi:hypothetical protein